MRRDVHAEVTKRIVCALESGDGERWRSPWVSMAAGGIPMNALTESHYRGINILNLWSEAQRRGFGSARWATFRQWRTLDAQVRRGETASRVVFYRTLRRREEAEDTDTGETEVVEHAIRVVRYTSVFNADQVAGYEDPDAASQAPSIAEAVGPCDRFIEATGAEIRRNAGSAYYDPGLDLVALPADELFNSTEGKYSAAFHELTHWTGHPSRLDRREGMKSRFGSTAYAAEELVAELGGAFVCARFGLEPEPRPDHASYIKQWLRLLNDDEKAIFTAASRASDAVEFMERESGYPGENIADRREVGSVGSNRS
jgi:antirestriction protein ArdC